MASDEHKRLCDLAYRWLKRPRNQYNLPKSGAGCTFAIHEVSSGYQSEIADAFGMRTNFGSNLETVLVEVKVSKSDFLADQKKPFREQPETGMGNYRYYMAPEGLLSLDELPPKWGLIEVNKRGFCKVIKGHVLGNKQDFYFTSNRDKEITLCAWVLAKIADPTKLAKERQELMASRSRLVRHVDDLNKQLTIAHKRINRLEDQLDPEAPRRNR